MIPVGEKKFPTLRRFSLSNFWHRENGKSLKLCPFQIHCAMLRSFEVLQTLSWLEQKLGLNYQTTRFIVVSWIFGCFGANYNK